MASTRGCSPPCSTAAVARAAPAVAWWRASDRRANRRAPRPTRDRARAGAGVLRGGARLLLVLLHLLLRDLLHVTAIPERPLLAPWYRLAGDGDRLLLEHGQSAVARDGPAVRTLLPQLLPLLDGTRSYDELAARLGVAARPALDHALETLASHGLLVEGPAAPPDVRPAAHAVASTFDLAPSV